MLFDITSPRCVELHSFPGRVVVRISFRQDYEREDSWDEASLHGQEGVWYRPDNDRGNVIKQEPLPPTAEEHRLDEYGFKLFELKPEPCAPPHQVRRHRFLLRWWDRDVYFPTIQAQILTLMEHHQEEGPPMWSLSNGRFSVEGFEL